MPSEHLDIGGLRKRWNNALSVFSGLAFHVWDQASSASSKLFRVGTLTPIVDSDEFTETDVFYVSVDGYAHATAPPANDDSDKVVTSAWIRENLFPFLPPYLDFSRSSNSMYIGSII